MSTPVSAPPLAVTHAGEGILGKPWYWNYVLLALTICYIVNVMDRSQILAASIQAIKKEFGATDFQLGLLSGIPFALFYSFLGIPIAALADRWSRMNVLALAVATWSGMTALCGMAVNFPMLFAARIGTAIGEAGGSPPSHSLISDYFPRSWRGTAFSFYALAVPVGTALGAFMGGWGNQHLGWRNTFILVGVPGILLALLVRLTVREPPRGMADGMSLEQAAKVRAPGLVEVLSYLWARRSFRHLSLAAALHSVVWYSSGAFNNAFLQRSHQLSAYEAGGWIAILSLIAGFGTFLGGFACDRLSTRFNDRRWYLWVPGVATLLCVPFQFLAYLSPTLTTTLPSFVGLMFMAAVFFGPSFAMTQALATVRMRSVATSLLLFIQTLIGNGLGPAATGYISDWLVPSQQTDSLRYALVIIGVVNVWAALHYAWAARTLRQDLQTTEALSTR
ncbi:MAG TPA: MFS transporter [Vicinamibacterales bacterium]|nr:MFS transporter [Vicinamibacterales bacterium]